MRTSPVSVRTRVVVAAVLAAAALLTPTLRDESIRRGDGSLRAPRAAADLEILPGEPGTPRLALSSFHNVPSTQRPSPPNPDDDDERPRPPTPEPTARPSPSIVEVLLNMIDEHNPTS